MDAIPGPRRPLFRHIAVPFLPDANTIPNEEEWRKGNSEYAFNLWVEKQGIPGEAHHESNARPSVAPSPVDSDRTKQQNPPLDHQQSNPVDSSEPTPRNVTVCHFDMRSQPIDRWSPAYWDIHIQKDDEGDSAFVGQDKRKTWTMSDKMCGELDISTDTGVAPETKSTSVLLFLSEKARRNKPMFLRTRDPQFTPCQTYDGLRFRSFPERMGYETKTLDHEWNSDSFLGFFHQRNGPEMAVFLQSWFFFEFMSEVFGKSVREQDFVTDVSRSETHCKVLTLQKFITTAQWKSWEPMVFDLSAEMRNARIKAIKHALDTASKFTRLEDSGRFFPSPVLHGRSSGGASTEYRGLISRADTSITIK